MFNVFVGLLFWNDGIFDMRVLLSWPLDEWVGAVGIPNNTQVWLIMLLFHKATHQAVAITALTWGQSSCQSLWGARSHGIQFTPSPPTTRARFFCFLHTVSWDEMSWASFSCSHEHMLTVSSVWVFLFYKSPISPEMGSPWAWDRNHGLFCMPTLPVCSARLTYIIFLNEACARDVGYFTSQSRQ